MGKGAIAIGIICILFGIWLIYTMISSNTPIWVLIYPRLAIGIGIALIILYKEEDIIEERKDLKSKKS
jgi:hypothetical protein